MTTMRKRFSIGLLTITIVLMALTACGRDKTDAATEDLPADVTAVPAAAATEVAQADEATEESSAESSASTAQDGGDPLAVVSNAMLAQLGGGPYRATTTINSDGTVTEMMAEVIPPHTMHIVIGGGNMEMILLEDTVWSKSGDAPWAQMGSPEMMQGIFAAIQGQADANNLVNVQHVGAEPVMGVATDVYTFESAMGDGEGAVTSDVKLWIAKESGLPVRMESSSVANGVTTTAIQTVEYDDTITITAPTP